MTERSAWERQRREVNAYNLFYSSLTARAHPSLGERGYRLVGSFAEVGRSDLARPDFVVYDGSVCVLIEVKAGNNLNDRHIEQMEACASVSIETAEEYLRDAQVRELGFSGEVSAIESCIVYQDINEEYVEKWRDESPDFRENLDDIVANAVLLTQDYGGRLRILEGSFANSPELQSILSGGVNLPENPPDEIMLTENMEEEILAVAICDIWGERVLDHDDPIEVTREGVRDYFAPRHNVPPGNLGRVFEFLGEFGACSHIEENRYKFSRNNIRALLKVEEAISEQRVEEYLRAEDQATFSDFEDPDGNTAAGP